MDSHLQACPRENEDTYLTKILETKPTTFNGIKQAINAMLEFASTKALSKNEKLANDYFKIKSKRLKKKCVAEFLNKVMDTYFPL